MEIDRNYLIGERVRFYRTARKMSMAELAAELKHKLSAQQIALYERGKSRWPAELLCEISIILRIDLRTLSGMEDSVRSGRKDSPDWDAENYKAKLLALTPKFRQIAYQIIDIFADGISKN